MNGHRSARPVQPGDIQLPSKVGTNPHLTLVELTWVEKRIEHWIRFGRPVSDQIIDRRRRVVSFVPGSF
ncbi:DUF2840 domain-containing protein, partial [Acinetobacter baumannii]